MQETPERFGELLTVDRGMGRSRTDDSAARATALRPGSAEFWHFRGMAERRAGALAAAFAAQEHALALEPDHAGARQQCEQLAPMLAAAPRTTLPAERGSHAAG